MKTQASPPLSDRAKKRLKLVAGLLRSSGKLKLSRENFYDEMMAHLNALPTEDQAELKALVDWLEDYEKAEQPTPNLSVMKKAFTKKVSRNTASDTKKTDVST